MTIPNFKTQDDWQDFLNVFDDQWQCKKTMLDRVKDDLFPGYRWEELQPKTLDVINDIVSNFVYEVERQFKETHEGYEESDDIFIPRSSLKQTLAEVLKETQQEQTDEL